MIKTQPSFENKGTTILPTRHAFTKVELTFSDWLSASDFSNFVELVNPGKPPRATDLKKLNTLVDEWKGRRNLPVQFDVGFVLRCEPNSLHRLSLVAEWRHLCQNRKLIQKGQVDCREQAMWDVMNLTPPYSIDQLLSDIVGHLRNRYPKDSDTNPNEGCFEVDSQHKVRWEKKKVGEWWDWMCFVFELRSCAQKRHIKGLRFEIDSKEEVLFFSLHGEVGPQR
jgi:hypothetical protein